MSTNAVNTMATLLVANARDLQFPGLMGELCDAIVALRLPLEEVSMEGPNLVTYQVGGTRLTAVLREGPLKVDDYADYRRPAGLCDPANDEAAVDRLASHRLRLVLSCGLASGAPGTAETACETFRTVLSRIMGRVPSALVLWPHDRTLFTADEFARFLDPGAAAPAVAAADAAVPEAEVVTLPRRPRRRSEARAVAARNRTHAAVVPANDLPDLPPVQRDELDRVRAALYPEPEAKAEGEANPTLAMRLSATAMDMTLLIVAMPVGAAVITHNVLRGRTDMRLSARMMALTGAVMAFTQSGVGQILGVI